MQRPLIYPEPGVTVDPVHFVQVIVTSEPATGYIYLIKQQWFRLQGLYKTWAKARAVARVVSCHAARRAPGTLVNSSLERVLVGWRCAFICAV